MRRFIAVVLVAASSAILSSSQATGVKAVVKTRFDTAIGGLGGVITALAGAGDVAETVALTAKGNRLVRDFPDRQGIDGGSWIVDLDEEKTYRLLANERAYKVGTFSEVRRAVARDHHMAADTLSAADLVFPTADVDLPAQSRRRAQRFGYVVNTRETGARRSVAGYETREVVLTLTAVERGKTLEQDGGWVVTNTVWLAPRIPAVDELVAAERRYARALTKGIYDTAFTQVEFRLGQIFDPYMPEHAIVGINVIAETEKLDGTVLASTTVYEIERTAKEMKFAEAQHRRLSNSGDRVLGGGPPKRTRLVTLQLEYASIDTNVPDADVRIPAGFTIKK